MKISNKMIITAKNGERKTLEKLLTELVKSQGKTIEETHEIANACMTGLVCAQWELRRYMKLKKKNNFHNEVIPKKKPVTESSQAL